MPEIVSETETVQENSECGRLIICSANHERYTLKM